MSYPINCDTGCFFEGCITNSACEPSAPGGWTDLFVFNKCHLAGKTYEALGNDTTAIVSSIALVPGTFVYRIKFNDATGMQFDTIASDSSGSYIHTNTIVLDSSNWSPLALSRMRSIMGAKITAIARGNNGRFFIMGLGTGLRATEINQSHGRLGTDPNIWTLTMQSIDSIGARPFNVLNSGDIELDDPATMAFLEGLVQCTDYV